MSKSAFPTAQYAHGISPSSHDHGMDLRDYFATAAMQGLLSTIPLDVRVPVERVADEAYAMAEAMMSRRAR